MQRSDKPQTPLPGDPRSKRVPPQPMTGGCFVSLQHGRENLLRFQKKKKAYDNVQVFACSLTHLPVWFVLVCLLCLAFNLFLIFAFLSFFFFLFLSSSFITPPPLSKQETQNQAGPLRSKLEASARARGAQKATGAVPLVQGNNTLEPLLHTHHPLTDNSLMYTYLWLLLRVDASHTVCPPFPPSLLSSFPPSLSLLPLSSFSFGVLPLTLCCHTFCSAWQRPKSQPPKWKSFSLPQHLQSRNHAQQSPPRHPRQHSPCRSTVMTNRAKLKGATAALRPRAQRHQNKLHSKVNNGAQFLLPATPKWNPMRK